MVASNIDFGQGTDKYLYSSIGGVMQMLHLLYLKYSYEML